MKPLNKEDKAGLYITVSIHLAVIIVLLLSVVTPALRSESRIEFDFSEWEELQKLKEELEFKKEINKRLNELMQENGMKPIEDQEGPKAVAVNRHIQDLMDENARIQKDIKESLADKAEASISFDEAEFKPLTEESKGEYTGPSVISYDLGGRKASHMPIPAYKCYGGGEVTVLIVVNPNGNVLDAKIKDDVSSTDACLRQYALNAAKRAVFSRDPSAPARQRGDIVYGFIAQ